MASPTSCPPHLAPSLSPHPTTPPFSLLLSTAFAFIILSVVVAKQLQLAAGPAVAALWITITNIAVPLYLKVAFLFFALRDANPVYANVPSFSLLPSSPHHHHHHHRLPLSHSLQCLELPRIASNRPEQHLCFEVEDHVSLNDQQMSLFFKLSFFRWCNRYSLLSTEY